MRKLILLLTFLGLAACQGNTDYGGNISGKTIVGGEEADATNPLSRLILSHRTILTDNGGEDAEGTEVRYLQCSASALTKTLILTAAHCVKPDTSSTIDFKDADGRWVSTPVVKATIIDEYQTNNDADLAILTLSQPLPDFIQMVTLPEPTLPIDLKKTKLMAAGWGRNVDVAPYGGAGTLRFVGVSITNYAIEESTFIVDQTDGKGMCQGDSGGPGLIEFQGKNYVLGVAKKTMFVQTEDDSETHKCNYKGTYVNVLKYKKWIVDTVNALSQEPAQSSLSEDGASL
ncbi:MAG: trypsin-like serine protease [Bdellovibrio sp.]|nr:trypsin-like serine protease [Bdellovibrio sp.]